MFKYPSAEEVKAAMLKKGYAVFESPRGYDLNIFGIRMSDREANTFNDVLGVMYMFDGRWNCFLFPATTDPGLYWRKNLMNVDGTAMIVPGQYRGAYKVGTHKGYPALQQRKPIKVYRDADRNSTLDPDPSTIQNGVFATNIHRSNQHQGSVQVDKWSAGCQVFQDPVQFEFLMSLARKGAELYGNEFTYTLLEEVDFS